MDSEISECFRDAGNRTLVIMHQTSRITKKCDDLTQLIGAVCMPYCLNPVEWSIPDSAYRAAFGNDDLPLIVQATKEAQSTGIAALLQTANSQSVFAIPLGMQDSNSWFAVGRTPQPPTASVVQLLRVATVAMERQNAVAEREEALLMAESELHRFYEERAWIRELNSQRAVRKRNPNQNSKQAIESVRRLIDAEAVGIFVFADRNTRNQGLESMITAHPSWGVDDIKLIVQRLPKPELGDANLACEINIPLRRGRATSAAIVPIGETSVIGYIVAVNRKKSSPGLMNAAQDQFSHSAVEVLLEVSDYLLADGYANLILEESEQLVLGTLRAMSSAIEARDPYTHGHSERVAQVGFEIAQRLNLSDTACQEIYLAGILHDIGKIGIPDAVLLKPGKLEPDEFAIIQKHPEIGYKIIDELGKLKFALPGVLYHHERMDGTGYPHKLHGEEIPLMARILAVADAYDAMTTSRVYRNAMGATKAVEILRSGIGTQWDADAVHACLDWLDERSLVLVNGESENGSRFAANPGRLLSQALRAVQL